MTFPKALTVAWLLTGLAWSYSALRADAASDPEIILRRAFAAQVQGDDAEAVRSFEEFFRTGRESGHARAEYAKTLARVNRFEEANDQARRAMLLDPRNSDYVVMNVELLRRAGQKKKALELLEDMVNVIPGDAGIEFHLAELYNDMGRSAEARVRYTQVLFHVRPVAANGPFYRSVSLWRLAVLYYRESDFDRARFYLLRYIKYNPERLYAHYMLGFNIYFRQGEYEKARRELEFIVQRDPRLAAEESLDLDDVNFALGQIYFIENDPRYLRYLGDLANKRKGDLLLGALVDVGKGENEKAVRFLAPFATKHGDHFVARIALVRAVGKMGRPDIHIEELIRVSRLALTMNVNRIGIELCEEALLESSKNPEIVFDQPETLRLIASHYEEMKQPHRAILYLDKAEKAAAAGKDERTQEQKDQHSLWMARLLGQSGVRRFNESLEILEGLMERPTALVLSTRGLVYLEAGEADKSTADFTRAIEMDGSKTAYYYFRALAHHQKGRSAEAEADLRKVLSDRPDFADANNFLGYLMADRGAELEESLRLIQKAIDASPANAAYQDSLGWVYYRMGRFEEARNHLELAALLLEEAGSEEAEIYDHLGDIYVKLSKPAEAVSAWQKASGLLARKRARLTRLGLPLSADDTKLEAVVKGKLERK